MEQSGRSPDGTESDQVRAAAVLFDYNPVFGGPIKQNKLWYFGSVSANRSNSQQAGHLFQAVRTVDTAECQSRPATIRAMVSGYTGAVMTGRRRSRFKHQVASKHKLVQLRNNTRLNNLYGNT